MKQRKRVIAASFALTISILGLALASCGDTALAVNGSNAPPTTTPDAVSHTTPDAIASTAPPKKEKPDPAPAPEATVSSTGKSNATDKSDATVKSDATNKSNATGKSDAADDSYFDDAVFIGDSLTEGFQMHGGLTNATYFGFKNLNVKEIFEKPLVKSANGKITIADALRQTAYGKYYIMMGANELGWVYPQVFTKKYGELIDLAKEKNPDAKIYLQSVLPVSEETSRTNKYYSNSRIDYYDELIVALAEEKNVTYLNVRESVQNEAGVLPSEAATDGVHLNKEYCQKWADYLRNHK